MTTRNPENTRAKIIAAAFQEMHMHGYQGMRIDQVLKKTGLKKGAMYHHFSSKQTLGYAVLEERIQKKITELWIAPLKDFNNPLEGIHTLYKEIDNWWSHDFFIRGCPLNNLAQEMSPLDEGFRSRIADFFLVWKTAIEEALKNGQHQGIVDQSINTNDCALFILSATEGALGLTKNQQNKEVYYSCGRELERYLQSLRSLN